MPPKVAGNGFNQSVRWFQDRSISCKKTNGESVTGVRTKYEIIRTPMMKDNEVAVSLTCGIKINS